MVLQNVVLVPNLSYNPISLGNFLLNYFKVMLNSGKKVNGLCLAEQVLSSKKLFIRIKTEKKGLFEVVLRIKSSNTIQALSLKTDTSRLCNSRLRNAGASRIKRTLPLVDGMDRNKYELENF